MLIWIVQYLYILEHYRRHFTLQDDWVDVYLSNDIDVILPTPLYVVPSIAENYRNRHISSDYEFMMGVSGGLYPEYYEVAVCYFETNGIYWREG